MDAELIAQALEDEAKCLNNSDRAYELRFLSLSYERLAKRIRASVICAECLPPTPKENAQ